MEQQYNTQQPPTYTTNVPEQPSGTFTSTDTNVNGIPGAMPVTPQQPVTLEDKLVQLQQKWTAEIGELNGMMKSLPKLDELLNIIYTKRQEAVEYYHSMNSIILKQTKEYKQEFNTICTSIRVNGLNGVRVANDTAIAKHAEGALIDKKTAIVFIVFYIKFVFNLFLPYHFPIINYSDCRISIISTDYIMFLLRPRARKSLIVIKPNNLFPICI